MTKDYEVYQVSPKWALLGTVTTTLKDMDGAVKEKFGPVAYVTVPVEEEERREEEGELF